MSDYDLFFRTKVGQLQQLQADQDMRLLELLAVLESRGAGVAHEQIRLKGMLAWAREYIVLLEDALREGQWDAAVLSCPSAKSTYRRELFHGQPTQAGDIQSDVDRRLGLDGS